MIEKTRCQRVFQIDILRAIGTISVILAHVGSPPYINNIRCFDVVLLFLVSGMSMQHNRFLSSDNYGAFLKKRTKKLLLPTWALVLTWYFGTTFFCMMVNHDPIYSISDFINALFLMNGNIGYVWIVKIYLISALLTPVFQKLSQSIKSGFVYYIFLAALSVLYFVCEYLYKEALSIYTLSTLTKTIVEDYLLGVVAYLLVVLVGYRISEKNKGNILIFCALMFLASFVFNNFMFEPNRYKYPPDIIYVFYGLTCSMILLCVVPNKRIRIFEWISKNSFSIYLVHAVFILGTIKMNNWLLRYLLVLALTMSTVFIFQKAKQIMFQKTVD